MALKLYSEFLDYCRSLNGKTLYTHARKKAFSIEVEGNSIFFIPFSSGKPRKANPKKIELALEKLNKTGYHSPRDYQEITFHASYILSIAENHTKK